MVYQRKESNNDYAAGEEFKRYREASDAARDSFLKTQKGLEKTARED